MKRCKVCCFLLLNSFFYVFLEIEETIDELIIKKPVKDPSWLSFFFFSKFKLSLTMQFVGLIVVKLAPWHHFIELQTGAVLKHIVVYLVLVFKKVVLSEGDKQLPQESFKRQ